MEESAEVQKLKLEIQFLKNAVEANILQGIFIFMNELKTIGSELKVEVTTPSGKVYSSTDDTD